MKAIKNTLDKVRITNPLILNLTNVVTMDFVANCLLSIGASPIMSTCQKELEALIIHADVIYMNIGTLNETWIQQAMHAVKLAKKHHTPIVLDPVGCGATSIRTKTAATLLNHCQIVRGNASEIMALNHHNSYTTNGVDAKHTIQDGMHIANQVAQQMAITVAMSGEIDYITHGSFTHASPFGSPIMTKITGMGCALTAVIAAILAVTKHPYDAAVIGTQYFSLCGQLTAKKHRNPGTFKCAFIDTLYRPDYSALQTLYETSLGIQSTKTCIL